MKNISFKKPKDFTPYFTAKLKHNLSYALPLWGIALSVIILLFTDKLEGHVTATLLTLLCFYGLYNTYRSNNFPIIEVSKEGIWLLNPPIYISKDSFDKALEFRQERRNLVVINNIHIQFKVLNKERWLLFKEFLYTEIKCKKISHEKYHVSLPIPFTIGRGEEIQLDVTKAELINILDEFKKQSAIITL